MFSRAIPEGLDGIHSVTRILKTTASRVSIAIRSLTRRGPYRLYRGVPGEYELDEQSNSTRVKAVVSPGPLISPLAMESRPC